MATSIEVSNVQRLRMWSESTFASDGTGTLGNYTDVPFIEGTLSAVLGQEMLAPMHAQQYIDGWATRVLGNKSCKLAFQINLAPTGDAATDAEAHAQSALGRLLKAVMGGQTLGTGDTVSGASNTTVFTAAGNTFVAGDVIGINRGASSAYEMREVESMAAGVITTKLAFSNAPQVGDVVHGCQTHFLAASATTAESLQFILEGLEVNDRWVLLGCQLESMSLDLTLGQIPKLTLNFVGVNWMTGEDAAYSSTSTLAAATYTNVSPIHAVGELLVQTLSTSTRPTPSKASSIQVNIALGYVPIPSPSGTQGIAGWQRARKAPAATCVITQPFPESVTSNEPDFMLARDAITRKAVWFQMGSVAGKGVLVSLPTCVITDYQLGDAGGIRSEITSYEAQNDGDVGSSVTAQALSAFRIACG